MNVDHWMKFSFLQEFVRDYRQLSGHTNAFWQQIKFLTVLCLMLIHSEKGALRGSVRLQWYVLIPLEEHEKVSESQGLDGFVIMGTDNQYEHTPQLGNIFFFLSFELLFRSSHFVMVARVEKIGYLNKHRNSNVDKVSNIKLEALGFVAQTSGLSGPLSFKQAQVIAQSRKQWRKTSVRG